MNYTNDLDIETFTLTSITLSPLFGCLRLQASPGYFIMDQLANNVSSDLNIKVKYFCHVPGPCMRNISTNYVTHRLRAK